MLSTFIVAETTIQCQMCGLLGNPPALLGCVLKLNLASGSWGIFTGKALEHVHTGCMCRWAVQITSVCRAVVLLASYLISKETVVE